MTVEAVYRYPVKSMRGETLARISLADGHVTGDRQWGVVDAASGLLLSAKRHGELLKASARTGEDGAAVLSLPSGDEVSSSDPKINDVLSAWLGREVELRPPGAATPFELLADALDESSEVIHFQGPTTHFADLADVHLLTDASLRAAGALHSSDWDVRRFRPTALLTVDGDDFVEDSWVGSTVELGSAAVNVFMPAVRCSLPPRAQPGIPRDTGITRALKEHHGFSLGVYCSITRDGSIGVGDAVHVAAG
jgi:uncharacterized protein YcbX